MNGLARFAWRSLGHDPSGRRSRSSASPSASPCSSRRWPPTPASRPASSRTVDDVMGRSRPAGRRLRGDGPLGGDARGDPLRRRAWPSPPPCSNSARTSSATPLATTDSTADAYASPITVIGIDPTIDGRPDRAPRPPLIAGQALDGAGTPRRPGHRPVSPHDLGLGVGDSTDAPRRDGPVRAIGRRASWPAAARIRPAAGRARRGRRSRASTALFGARGATLGRHRPGRRARPSTAVATALEQRLTFEPYVPRPPGPTSPRRSQASTADFQALTALIAAVTLFGGAFLIFNTLSMTLVGAGPRDRPAARGRDDPRPGPRLVLIQALILGVGRLGPRARRWATACRSLIARTVGSLGDAGVPIDGPVVPPLGRRRWRSVGILVTLAAALEPAIQAGRISPIEALRPARRRPRLARQPAALARSPSSSRSASPASPCGRSRSGRSGSAAAAATRLRPATRRLRRPARRDPAHAADPRPARARRQPAVRALPAGRRAPGAWLARPRPQAGRRSRSARSRSGWR